MPQNWMELHQLYLLVKTGTKEYFSAMLLYNCNFRSNETHEFCSMKLSISYWCYNWTKLVSKPPRTPYIHDRVDLGRDGTSASLPSPSLSSFPGVQLFGAQRKKRRALKQGIDRIRAVRQLTEPLEEASPNPARSLHFIQWPHVLYLELTHLAEFTQIL